ncbi:unnamed protein product, partial [Chrysoparadoxa australica]
ITILHTNDLHSYFRGTIEKVGNSVERVGGHSYLAKEILDIKKILEKQKENVLIFDAGDFYSGTLYHSLVLQNDSAYFPEYQFFNYLNYDAVTLGNHEFDGGDAGFKLMMNKVIKLGNEVPIVSTNFVRKDSAKYPILNSKLLQYKNYEGKTFSVGILGALGPDGCSVSKGNRKLNTFIGYDDKKHKDRWKDLNNLLEEEGKNLKKKGADFVVLLLHGGTEEDDFIAKKVDSIDVIIAGHTHEVYLKEVEGKIVSQAGSYARFLGVIPIELKGKKVSLRSAHPHVASYHKKIERINGSDKEFDQTLELYDREVDRVLVANEFPKNEDFTFVSQSFLSKAQTGEFVTSKILAELNAEDADIDFYFTALGLIRNPLHENFSYSLTDTFNILPIGFHDGNKLGYKVVSFYLSNKDVKKLIEFLGSYSRFTGTATPVFSNNIEIEYRKWGIPFLNKVKEIKINGEELPEFTKVATNTFLFDYLDFIEKKTFGLVKITPVDGNGNKIKKPHYHGPEVKYFLNSIGKD